MALSASTVWEVRTTGSDSNGGGFVAGASGTDYSQQDAAQYSFTDLVVDGTTNTKVTSASHNFVAADVGNLINISAGAGWTTGFYQIVSVASNAATLDRSPAAVSTTGGTWAEGGALATIGKLAGAVVAGNQCWVKAGTYTVTSTIAWSTSGSTGSGYITAEGYTTTRGARDGRPLITTATNSTTLITLTGNYARFNHLNLSNTASIRGNGFYTYTTGGAYLVIDDCVLDGFATAIAEYSAFMTLTVSNSVIKNSTASAVSVGSTALYNFSKVLFSGNVTDNILATYGSASILCSGCIFSGGTYGIRYSYNGGFLQIAIICDSCSFYNQSSDAIRISDTTASASLSLFNSVFWSIGGYAIASSTTGTIATAKAVQYNNAFGSITSGNRLNIGVGISDVTLTANPFVNAGSGNFALNTTSGGGAALRAAGLPGSFPGGTSTGYLDIGAVQHQDSPSTIFVASQNVQVFDTRGVSSY